MYIGVGVPVYITLPPSLSLFFKIYGASLLHLVVLVHRQLNE